MKSNIHGKDVSNDFLNFLALNSVIVLLLFRKIKHKIVYAVITSIVPPKPIFKFHMGHIVQYENDLNPYMHTLSCILEQCVLSSICSLHYCCSSPGKQHGSSRVEWWMVIRKKVCILIS